MKSQWEMFFLYVEKFKKNGFNCAQAFNWFFLV